MNAYELIQRDELKEYQAQGTLYRHRATDAEIYHISCDDQENSFAFSFATPPENHRGLPHILEHTVLCGSENYPIKDPFITLYKGSMHTFLNAFTAPDRTVYPASSVVEKDFFNLMAVYGDAVFFPLLKKEAFMQEGHHVQLDEEGNPQRSGIVFNEMKGSYSSHESLLAEYSFRDLFPNTPMAVDSGGDPRYIPDLTYQEFLDFHRKYYHPSNCKIYLYGNISIEKSLQFLDERFLSKFEKAAKAPALELGQRWTQELIKAYPAPKGENDGCSHSLNWRLGPAKDPFQRLAMLVLSQILTGHGGSPLQMAMQKTHLGEDLSPVSGLELDVGDMIYTLAIRGSKKAQAQEFRDFVFAELKKLADQGIPADQVEGALRLVEFREREIRGGTPFGLRLMGRLMRSWYFQGQPSEGLEFNQAMVELREKATDVQFWQKLIKEQLLDNSHYSLITLFPDESYEEEQQRFEEEQTMSWVHSLTEEDKKQWEQDLKDLKEFQDQDDDPAVLDSIPFLTHDEIPKEVSRIEWNKEELQGVDVYRLEPFTNGVFYADLGFCLDDLTREERLWIPFFCHGFSDLGARDLSYDAFAHRLALEVGGLHANPISSTVLNQQKSRCHVVVRAKMLKQQLAKGLELLEDLLFHRNFHQEKRMKELLVEMRNDMKTSLVPNGTGYALTRAAAGVNSSTQMDELWYGISQLEHLQEAVERLEKDGVGWLAQTMEDLSKKIFTSLDWMSMSCSSQDMEDFRSVWLDRALNWERRSSGNYQDVTQQYPLEQAFQIPASVSYSSAVIQGAPLNSREYCAQLVIGQLLKTGYLWEHIRMKGGAYGGGAGSSGLEEYFHFTAYRDPRGVASFEVFRNALNYMAKNCSQKDLDLALIGIVGKDLKPLAPAQKAAMAVRRDLYGISTELRQNNRNHLLALTIEDVQQWASELGKHWDTQRSMTMLAGKDSLQAAGEEIAGFKENYKVLPL